MKKCIKCEKFKHPKCFSRDKYRKDGLCTYCKTCQKQYRDSQLARQRRRALYIEQREEKLAYQKTYASANKRKIQEYQKTYGKKYYEKTKHTSAHRYKAYKGDARRRGFDFFLTVEEFALFWQQPCEYCGITISAIGIDRRDNQKGYELDNCVSCCSVCNLAKGQLVFDEWMAYLEQVAIYHRTGLIKQTGLVVSCGNLKRRYGTYQHNAKRKGLAFKLTLEQFTSFSDKPCEYCGRMGVVGIDRVDNNAGYEEDNCVPCCKNCNSGKNNGSLMKWLNWRTRVAERSQSTQ